MPCLHLSGHSWSLAQCMKALSVGEEGYATCMEHRWSTNRRQAGSDRTDCWAPAGVAVLLFFLGCRPSPCSHLHLLCVSTVLPAFLSSHPGNLDHTEHEGCSSVFLLWWGLRKAVLAVESWPVWSCCTSGGQSVCHLPACLLCFSFLPINPH